ncbi:MAG: DegT/DnrJ/EryC1/StrS family aminotransferase [Thermoguttaceae bacterium]|nr:DegT/DnrJ/EryC1/StrS family aminotransferase [Thermoguttaceae bacterium]
MSTERIEAVPMLDLKRQFSVIGARMNESLLRVNESGQFILGPEVKKLEENVAKYSRTNFAVGCASGSDALLLSLMALNVGKGDEVIVPSFTFFATASCVPRVGATPIFADIDPVSFNLDPQKVAEKITEKTKAIIVVHLFGQAADMTEFQALVNDVEAKTGRKIYVIEDSCQAIGAELDGVSVGNWGDASCLSFYPTKNLGGAGDGGMVVCNDQTVADRVRLLRGHGMAPRYYHKEIGINSRLDSYQAAILNVKLPYLDQWTEMRGQNAARYEKLFAEAGLSDVVVTPKTTENRRHVWNQYVIRVLGGKRDELRAYLAEFKIGTDIYYPLGLHQQECFAYLGYKPEDLPETLKAANEVLALPIYPELTAEEQIFLVEKVKTFFEQ